MTQGHRADFSIIDELYRPQASEHRRLSFADLFASVASQTNAVRSKVRVRLNRKLTWSEREEFRKFAIGYAFDHRFNNDDPSEVHISSSRDSRSVVELISQFVATEFLNVHPKSVKTIFPETRV